MGGGKDTIKEFPQSNEHARQASASQQASLKVASTSWLRRWCCSFSLLVDEGYPELPDNEELCPITGIQVIKSATSMHKMLTSGPRDALLAQKAKLQVLCADMHT